MASLVALSVSRPVRIGASAALRPATGAGASAWAPRHQACLHGMGASLPVRRVAVVAGRLGRPLRYTAPLPPIAAATAGSTDGGEASAKPNAFAVALAAAPAAVNKFVNPLATPEANFCLHMLCVAQMLLSVGTLMISSVLAPFMSSGLGMSSSSIGFADGLAQLMGFTSKAFSGILSDMTGNYKAVIMVGFVMSTLGKPLFAAAGPVAAALGPAAGGVSIMFAKIVDRMSKGIRDSPTTALLTQISDRSRGAAISLATTSTTVGALLGTTITRAILRRQATENLGAVFFYAAVPCLAAIAVLQLFVKIPESPSADVASPPAKAKGAKAEEGLAALWSKVVGFSPSYWAAVAVVSVLYMARFETTFCSLRIKDVGLPTSAIPGMLGVNVAVQAGCTYAFGLLRDRLKATTAKGDTYLMLIGFLALLGANLCFIYAPTAAGMTAAFSLVGVHMAMTQANTKALITDTVPKGMAGTAMSFFNVLSGWALLTGNWGAGLLNEWSVKHGLGMVGAFYGGGGAALAASTLLVTAFIWPGFAVAPAKPKARSLDLDS